jgi:hypothetical protein
VYDDVSPDPIFHGDILGASGTIALTSLAASATYYIVAYNTGTDGIDANYVLEVAAAP